MLMDEDLLKQVKKGKATKRAALIIVIAAVAVFILAALKPWQKTAGNTVSVTFEIRCDSLSENMDALNDEGLRDYIPEDGTIFPKSEVQIESGVTTVFQLTDKVCKENDIHIDYSYSPGYDSHYIKAINYMYELSAGVYSGWMYSVNGEVPNYGADKIVLEGGEEVQWFYTVDYR